MYTKEFVTKHAKAISWIRKRCPRRPPGELHLHIHTGARFFVGEKDPICPLGACRGAIFPAPSHVRAFSPPLSREEWYNKGLLDFTFAWDYLTLPEAKAVAKIIWPKKKP